MKIDENWMPLNQASIHYGYKNLESFRRRLRQLRRLGLVVDIGNPPPDYPNINNPENDHKITVWWFNPKLAFVQTNLPLDLFDPKPGKRKPIW